MEETGSQSDHLLNISSAPNQHTLLRISGQSNSANPGHLPSSLYSQLTDVLEATRRWKALANKDNVHPLGNFMMENVTREKVLIRVLMPEKIKGENQSL